jgi:hypothetical protein
MTLRQFYDWQTMGGGADVSALVRSLEELQIPWCMIGGLAVNHWASEPMATADVNLVIAAERVEDAVSSLKSAGFSEERFEWSINMKGNSRVSIQISTEDFYRDFPSRAVPADVHGILMRVAGLEDTLQGKIAAYSDPSRRPSKRQKDLTDISRLIEAHPELASQLPPSISERLEH